MFVLRGYQITIVVYSLKLVNRITKICFPNFISRRTLDSGPLPCASARAGTEHVHLRMHMHEYAFVHAHVHTRAHTCIITRASTRARMCTCTCVCTVVRMNIGLRSAFSLLFVGAAD